jgi:hypothetical protein
LPDVVSCGKAREIISELPYVDANDIPDTALWAAVVCLGILAHTYRYEEKYDGYEGDFRWSFVFTDHQELHGEPASISILITMMMRTPRPR